MLKPCKNLLKMQICPALAPLAVITNRSTTDDIDLLILVLWHSNQPRLTESQTLKLGVPFGVVVVEQFGSPYDFVYWYYLHFYWLSLFISTSLSIFLSATDFLICFSFSYFLWRTLSYALSSALSILSLSSGHRTQIKYPHHNKT